MIDVGSIWEEYPVIRAAVLILIIVTILLIMRRVRTQTNKNWQEAAVELGLNFTPRQLFWLPYEMEGTLNGGYYCKVHTWTEHRSNGESSGTNVTVTGVEVRFLESLGMGFNLSPSSGIKWLDSLMGVDDTEVGGDHDFDRMFAISSTDDMNLQKFLTAERKEILKAAATEMPYFEINDSGISAESSDVTRDKEAIIQVVMNFKSLAIALTSDGEEKEPDIFATQPISESSKSIFD